MRAADNGHSDIVRYLIEKGAEVNDKNDVSNWLSMYTYECERVCVFYSSSMILFHDWI